MRMMLEKRFNIGISFSSIVIFLLTCRSSHVDAVAVMSVDLGAEWMKVAYVSPGVPMEIALNKESKRKTPMAIAFRGDERTFGEDALTVGVRFPANCYAYILDLIGKQIDNPAVKLYQQRFPYYSIIADPVRSTVLFKHDNSTVFSPEELLGMLLHKAKEFAEESAGQTITEAVITVPGYFNQAERQSVLKAGELSGLKILQLMNDYTAAALSYGIFRRKDFNETAQYIMLYDMGAYSTSATIVSFQVVKSKEKGYVESSPQLSVLGVGYDRTLGGVEMQLRLRDHLAEKFNAMHKTKQDVYQNARAMAKLYKEAGRIKYILSANAETYAQVEGLVDEIDFKLLVTREEFEKLCSDLFVRVKNPVLQALKHSALTMDIINQVILVGAGTRVPAVQQALSEVVKTDLGKSLNTDEAVVLGAAYKAADLSKGFKVKKFGTKDAILFPIQVEFQKEIDSSKKEATKVVKRTLFGLMNPFPQKKILTFNKHQNDFSFLVHYGELDAWPNHEIQALGPTSLFDVSLTGVNDVISKHQEGENIESKGIKVHFTMDENGLLYISHGEYIVEKTLTAAEQLAQKNSQQSTFSRISSTISKLFQAADDELKEKAEKGEKPVHEDVGEGSAAAEKHDDEKQHDEVRDDAATRKSNQTETGAADDAKKSADNSNDQVKLGKEEEGFPASATNSTVPVATKEPVKPIIIKEPIAIQEKYLGVPALLPEQLTDSLAKIRKLNEYDSMKFRREGALNALESAVIDLRRAEDNDQILAFANEQESKNIKTKVDQISDWLDEEGYGASAEILETKLEELKVASKRPKERYQEYRDRPELISTLDKTLNSTAFFLTSVKNLTLALNQTDESGNVLSPYTPVELETLEKLISQTREWKDEMMKKQQDLPKWEDPIISSSLIKEKFFTLDREVRYLINKSRNWKPPTPSPAKKESTSEKIIDDTTTSGTEEIEEKSAASPDDKASTSKAKSKPPRKKIKHTDEADRNSILDEPESTDSVSAKDKPTPTNNNKVKSSDHSETDDKHSEL